MKPVRSHWWEARAPLPNESLQLTERPRARTLSMLPRRPLRS